MHYQVNLLKDAASPGPVKMLSTLKEETLPALVETGITPFGVFQGLFGLASNELYLVTFADDAHEITPPDGIKLSSQTHLVPTVRPLEHSPRTKAGIYVFRWFNVHNRDVDEIAQLSNTAWTTFEGGFNTEVQGLFAEPDQSAELGRMLLITWYADLNVWQDSRAPAPEARENFMKRHQLTVEAFPVCTRLVSADATPVVPGGQNRF